MSKLRICQFSTGFHPGDAISQEMISLDSYFKKIGYESELYSEHIDSSVRNRGNRYLKYKPKKNDLILYHHSIHSDVLEFVLKQPSRKILIYHNVTPAHFFEPYDLHFSYSLSKGKDEIREIKDRFIHSFADSEFNKLELESMGYKDVSILPIFYDFNILDQPYVIRNKFNGIKILFVGRISPNKKQEDLIRFAEIYRKYYRKDFQIQIVGYSSPASKKYFEELERMVRFWELDDHIHFSGYVTQSELNGYYKEADVFLSMSEHEGFCVPLLEAMHSNIPILAYSAGAVPDTLDGSGILFTEKNYPYIAEIIEELIGNQNFRNSILLNQNKRLERYNTLFPEEIIGRYIQSIES
jgi:glycosyltransferase involved in cell wall biosynthesis